MTLLKFQPPVSTKHPLDRFMQDFFAGGLKDFVGADFAHTQPSVNVVETPEQFKIEFAAPGFQKENFAVKVENGQLWVSGEVTERSKNENEKWTRREFVLSNFKRSFTLPETVNFDDIAAVYESGILTLTLPKKPEAQPTSKAISVE